MSDSTMIAMQEAELRLMRDEQRKMYDRKRDLLDQIGKVDADIMRLAWRIYDLEKRQ